MSNAFKPQSDHVKHLCKSRSEIKAHKDHDFKRLLINKYTLLVESKLFNKLFAA